MKIVVNGYSGSGKSTLARRLGELYQIPVLHLDTVHWLPGWEEKAEEQERSEVRAFMDRNASWVIDGNYRKLEYERRLQEADRIIFMDFNRFSCLFMKETCGEKTVVLKNQRQLDGFLESISGQKDPTEFP